MSASAIILIVSLGVSALLFLVLKFRLNAFIALLLTSILVGILAGMPLSGITDSIQEGMGNTLGFIAFGLIIGLPITFIAGPVFGRNIARKIDVQAPPELEDAHAGQAGKDEDLPRFGIIALIISVPLVLILSSTFVKFGIEKGIVASNFFADILVFIGHPFCALIIATLLSILLCLKRRFSKEAILELSTKSPGFCSLFWRAFLYDIFS